MKIKPWHVVAVLAIVFSIVISVVQCAGKPSYDVAVMYAGPAVLSSNDRSEISHRLSDVSPGTAVQFYDYYIRLGGGQETGGYSGANLEAFDNEILTGNALILLVSPDMYARVTGGDGSVLPLDGYLPEGTAPALYYDGTHRAVRLSATALYTLPAFARLPEDTLLCLRTPVSVANLFHRRDAEESHAVAARFFSEAVAYTPPAGE